MGGDGGVTDDAGAPCPAIGSSCTMQGERCGNSNFTVHCGAVEECASQDPTKPPNTCPISSRKYKDGIEYVDGEGLQQLHDETLQMRLATYRYKPQVDDPSKKHLGFIIEDTPPDSPAVQWSRERVDIYGYLSMVVATMQVQEKEIAELRKALDAAHEREATCADPAASSRMSRP